MKKLKSIFSPILLFCLVTIFGTTVTHCGSSDSEADSSTIRPKTLDLLRFHVGTPGEGTAPKELMKLRFIRGMGKDEAVNPGDVEEGAVAFTPGATSIPRQGYDGTYGWIVPGIDGGTFSAITPAKLDSPSYTYRAISDISGDLEISYEAITTNTPTKLVDHFFGWGEGEQKFKILMNFQDDGGLLKIGRCIFKDLQSEGFKYGTFEYDSEDFPIYQSGTTIPVNGTIRTLEGSRVPLNYTLKVDDSTRHSQLSLITLSDITFKFTSIDTEFGLYFGQEGAAQTHQGAGLETGHFTYFKDAIDGLEAFIGRGEYSYERVRGSDNAILTLTNPENHPHIAPVIGVYTLTWKALVDGAPTYYQDGGGAWTKSEVNGEFTAKAGAAPVTGQP